MNNFLNSIYDTLLNKNQKKDSKKIKNKLDKVNSKPLFSIRPNKIFNNYLNIDHYYDKLLRLSIFLLVLFLITVAYL